MAQPALAQRRRPPTARERGRHRLARLIGLILMFGAVSGAHFNPVVTLVDRLLGTISTRDTGLYVVAQTVGGCVGAVVANLMFEPARRSTCRPRPILRRAAGCPRSSPPSGCCW